MVLYKLVVSMVIAKTYFINLVSMVMVVLAIVVVVSMVS
jgi:hypothetical protein